MPNTTNTRLVKCVTLKKEAIGLDRVPYPGPLGEKIYRHVSQQAWNDWLKHMTILINEKRLILHDPDAKLMLKNEMIKFLELDSVD